MVLEPLTDPAPAGIVGRDDLLTTLAGAWDRSREGAGEVLVLLGEPAIGKSTLLGWLGERVGGAGVRLVCRGGALQPPMALAVDLAAALAPDGRARMGGDVDPVAVGAGLRDLLADAGADGRHPVAVLVDDLHDMDSSSRTALNLALRSIVCRHLLVVLTGRPTDAVLTFAEGFTTVEVPPLSTDDARGLLLAASEVPVASSVADRLLEEAGGNPLALLELPVILDAEHLTGRRLLPDPVPLAGDLRDAFLRPLAGLSSPARQLLEVASVSSDGAWPAVCDALDGSPEEPLAEVEAAGLAHLHDGHLVLRHPLLRAAVIAGMATSWRRQVNRRLARVDALPPEVRLLHRAHGTVGPDDDLVDDLVGAADGLRARGGAEAAARLLDHAVGLTAEVDRRNRLRIAAAEVLALSGASTTARERLQAVREATAAPELEVAATIRLAELDALNGDPLGAWQSLQECAGRDLGEQVGPDAVARVHTAMAVPLGMLGLVQEIHTQATQAVAHSSPGSTPWVVARVVQAHATAALDEGGVSSLVDEVLPRLDPLAAMDEDPSFGLHVGRTLGLVERYDTGTEILTSMIAHARSAGARASLAMSLGALGEIHVRSSRYEEARVVLDEAVALCLSTGQRAFVPFWLALRARVTAARGDHDAAAADVDSGLRITQELSLLGARYFLLACAGWGALARSDHNAVIAHLQECHFFEDASGVLSPNLARWRPDLVDALVARGDLDLARQVLAPLEEAASRPGANRWTTVAASLGAARLASATDLTAALEHVRQAATAADPEADRFELARARLLEAELLTAVAASTDGPERGGGEVVAAARDARFGFRMLGASAWEARVDAMEAGTGSAPFSFEALSAAELRVLVEVSNGLTNQEIATRLHLSPKTVANHLSRVYRKLGVVSRTEAARAYLTR